ncbi:putative surface protein with fasciclin (FAS1) repeats [Thermocatellispora tengchongensis]|uniref:Putative surface protein with fasciclin (FAS1) repeats n=1 Tax=Thermocatellispora tengchongensis TaxID=1073253 RepID=A0A840NVT3_9ACTN|nr:fasciclin domain-containing protein [Thermocatellispora tengchongensis]MBB5131332.1 putative surface protein with fasciclin (FAS1) repeats [Thermocatellispora tengchongensis]
MKSRTALLASGLAALALAPVSPFAQASAAVTTPTPPPDVATPAPTDEMGPTEEPTDGMTPPPEESPEETPPESPTDETATPTESPTGPAAAPFGPGCANLPTSGPGSVENMSGQPVGTAIEESPQLSMLAKAIQAAGLTDRLNSEQDITVFAPTDEAFKNISQEDLSKLMADKGQLTRVLENHVVTGKIDKDSLTAGPLDTLGGDQLTVTGSGEDFTVNGDAKISCGGITTQNATLYLVDKVLMP